ncbi:Casanova [Haplosporangium gracile]|nr:Casanova [Haplosporangium gracile]
MQITDAQSTQSSTSPKVKKFKGSLSLSSALQKKIPRPPNSFLIYRREHAVHYPGLVATALSAKLAISWRNETPERRKYYADLAKKAEKEHKLKYPDYKFTPAKRGTGKRARALQAAAAQAAKEAASTLPVQAGRLRQSSSKRPTHIAPKKRTSRSFELSTLPTPSPSPSASSSPSPPPEERTTPANRPRRNIQRPERFSPCGYKERPSHTRVKSLSSPDTELSVSMGAPPSLFFSAYADRSSRSSKILKSSASPLSVTSTSSSKSCEGSNDTCVDFEDLDCSNTSLSSREDDEDEDDEGEGEDEEEHDSNDSDDSDYEDKRMTLCSSDINQESFSSSDCVKTHGRSRSSSFQSQEPLFFDTTFASPYAMENFEPECLPRSDYQWPASALVGVFETLPTGPHIHPSPMLFSKYMYPIPGLEDPIIDFAEYANFDDQDNVEVKVEDKSGDKTAGSFETVARALNLAVDTIAASAAAASCSPFPMDTTIPLSLLSPTTATARAMESMSLTSLASSDNNVKGDKGTECL